MVVGPRNASEQLNIRSFGDHVDRAPPHHPDPPIGAVDRAINGVRRAPPIRARYSTPARGSSL